MADVNKTVAVKLAADTREYQRKMDAALGPRSPIAKLGALAVGATAAAGAAMAAFAGASVREFASLEAGMNEVFTLLPGTSETAMNEMTQDVQDFAREMGVLPDEVVPALYDAISAGVPRETVFDFLETANRLAVGGVTDLNTAVDGLTSSVNAYGEDTLSATEAADTMFTAVRLGKTTIEEISTSIGRVAPTAAAMGVSFTDVNAAIATMTSQGIQTSEAVTGLKALFSNMLRPTEQLQGATANLAGTLLQNGDASADVQAEYEALYTDLTTAQGALYDLEQQGVTSGAQHDALAEQVAGAEAALGNLTEGYQTQLTEGGNLQALLQGLSDSVGGNTEELAGMFGSVEALNAVLALTSEEGGAKFSQALTEMQDGAGATDAAYEQMDQGIARTWDRMKASLSSFMTEIGERLGPGVTRILSGALDGFNRFADDTLAFLDRILGDWDGTWADIEGNTSGVVAALLNLARSLWQGISAAFDVIVAAWEGVLKPMWDAISPAVEANLATLMNVVGGAIDVITGVLETLAALLRGDFTGAWEAVKTTAGKVFDRIANQARIWWDGVRGTFQAMVDFVNTVLDSMFGDLVRTSGASFDEIRLKVDSWWARVQAVLNGVVSWFDNVFAGMWQRMRNTAERWWTSLQSAVERIANSTKAAIERIWNAISRFLDGLWQRIRENAERIWNATLGRIMGPMEDADADLRALWEGIKTWLTDTWESLEGVASSAFSAVDAAVRSALGEIASWAEGRFSSLVNTIGDMVSDVVDRIRAAWDRVTSLGRRADQAAADVDDIETSLDEIDSELPGAGQPFGPGSDPSEGIDLPDIDETIMTPDDLADRGGLPSYEAGGLVMRDQIARLGEGGPEAVIPLDRLGALGGDQTIIVQLDGREISRVVAPRLVDGLRLRTGVSGL